MGDKSRIEWTDATWTPIRARRLDTGKVGVHCEKVSEACKNCYAERLNLRNLPAHGTGLEFNVLNRQKVEVFVDENILLQPLRWKRGRRIFVCSQTDLFGEFVPDEMIDRVFAVMALCPHHTFQVLTKRPERMLAWMTSPRPLTTVDSDVAHFAEHIGRIVFDSRGSDKLNYFGCAAGTDVSNRRRFPGWPLPHVWLGVTVEDQPRADERIPLLLRTPAAVRFVSAEPLLGPIDLDRCYREHGPDGLCDHEDSGLDWVIAGGESGPGARPTHPDWFRSLRDQCVAAGVPYFFKQWGDWAPLDQLPQEHGIKKNSIGPERCRWVHEDGRVTGIGCGEQPGNLAVHVGKRAAGRLLDGREWSEFPEVSGD